MSYRNLVNTNVARAFNLVKDLAEEATLTKKATSSFNFATGQAEVTTDAPVVTKAIMTELRNSSGDFNASRRLVMLKTAEVGDIKAYDTVTMAGVTWKVSPDNILSDGYVTTVEVYRES